MSAPHSMASRIWARFLSPFSQASKSFLLTIFVQRVLVVLEEATRTRPGAASSSPGAGSASPACMSRGSFCKIQSTAVLTVVQPPSCTAMKHQCRLLLYQAPYVTRRAKISEIRDCRSFSGLMPSSSLERPDTEASACWLEFSHGCTIAGIDRHRAISTVFKSCGVSLLAAVLLVTGLKPVGLLPE